MQTNKIQQREGPGPGNPSPGAFGNGWRQHLRGSIAERSAVPAHRGTGVMGAVLRRTCVSGWRASLLGGLQQ